MKKYLPFLRPLLIILAIFLVMFLVSYLIPIKSVKQIIQNTGWWGIIIFIILLWTTFIFAPLSGTPFLYLGFIVYGQAVVVYAYLASLVAAATNFLIARKWGRQIVEKLAGKENLTKADQLINSYGLISLLIIRLFLSQFHDVVSYAFGLTKLRFRDYFLISALGMIPGNFVWFFLSRKIHNPILFLVVHLVLAYTFLTLYFLVMKKKIKNIPPPSEI